MRPQTLSEIKSAIKSTRYKLGNNVSRNFTRIWLLGIQESRNEQVASTNFEKLREREHYQLKFLLMI